MRLTQGIIRAAMVRGNGTAISDGAHSFTWDEIAARVPRFAAVLRPGATLNETGLIAWSRDNMANYKVPRRAAFLDDLPRNAAGKVAKLELR